MQIVRCSWPCSASRARAEARRSHRAAVGSVATGERPRARQSIARNEGADISIEEVSMVRDKSKGTPPGRYPAGGAKASPSERESFVATGDISTKQSIASCIARSLLRANVAPLPPRRPGVDPPTNGAAAFCLADRPDEIRIHASPSIRSDPSGSSVAAWKARGRREEMGIDVTMAAAASPSESAAVSSCAKKSIAKARSACFTSASLVRVNPPPLSTSCGRRIERASPIDNASAPPRAGGGREDGPPPSVCLSPPAMTLSLPSLSVCRLPSAKRDERCAPLSATVVVVRKSPELRDSEGWRRKRLNTELNLRGSDLLLPDFRPTLQPRMRPSSNAEPRAMHASDRCPSASKASPRNTSQCVGVPAGRTTPCPCRRWTTEARVVTETASSHEAQPRAC
mmetsp:Transcript_8113/g.25337  ORF Transcript_8113/g.25337 Transcript_8113/m.25337 type:complete len:398 (-) Transcript_8113:3532-4725(-)